MKQILVPRKTGDKRKRNHRFLVQKKIKKYIKDGSQGDLILSDSPVEKLPDNLMKVGGSLSLINTPVKELPDNLKVGGHLFLHGTQIEELPYNLKVDGSLDLENTQVEKLPDNLKIGKGLILDNTPIKQLPNNLELRSLSLRNTPLSRKYTKQQIKDLIEQKGGYVNEKINL